MGDDVYLAAAGFLHQFLYTHGKLRTAFFNGRRGLLLAGRQKCVQLARGRLRAYLVCHIQQLICRIAHGGHHDQNAVPPSASLGSYAGGSP